VPSVELAFGALSGGQRQAIAVARAALPRLPHRVEGGRRDLEAVAERIADYLDILIKQERQHLNLASDAHAGVSRTRPPSAKPGSPRTLASIPRNDRIVPRIDKPFRADEVR
jgi:hypothetical protein